MTQKEKEREWHYNSPSVTLHRTRRRESDTKTHHLWHDTEHEEEGVALELTICDTTQNEKKREWHYNSPSVTLQRRRRRGSGTTTHHLWHDTEGEEERVALQLTICDTTQKEKEREWHKNSPSAVPGQSWNLCRVLQHQQSSHVLPMVRSETFAWSVTAHEWTNQLSVYRQHQKLCKQ